MNYFAVTSFVVLAIILVLSNATPQESNDSAAGPAGASGGSGFGVGGKTSGASAGASSGSLRKRDLANNAPIAHYVHSASCNDDQGRSRGQGRSGGQGGQGGQGGPGGPPPPRSNNTTSG